MNRRNVLIVLTIAAATFFGWRYYRTHNSHYQIGHLLGKGSFIVEDLKDLKCLERNAEALRDGSSQQCETRSERDPSTIESAMKEALGSNYDQDDERRGFEDGWRDEMRKTYAERDAMKR